MMFDSVCTYHNPQKANVAQLFHPIVCCPVQYTSQTVKLTVIQ